VLFFNVFDGGHTGRFTADLERFEELDAAAGPHAVAVVGRRQEAATGRMAVSTQATFGHWLLEEAPLPQRRQRRPVRRIGLAKRCGDTLDQVAAQLVVSLFATPDPGSKSRVSHRWVPALVFVFLQNATKPVFRESLFTEDGVRIC